MYVCTHRCIAFCFSRRGSYYFRYIRITEERKYRFFFVLYVRPFGCKKKTNFGAVWSGIAAVYDQQRRRRRFFFYIFPPSSCFPSHRRYVDKITDSSRSVCSICSTSSGGRQKKSSSSSEVLNTCQLRSTSEEEEEV